MFSGHPFGRPLTSMPRDAISLLTAGISIKLVVTNIHHVSRHYQKAFSRSQVKGQGHICTNVNAIIAEAYILTASCR